MTGPLCQFTLVPEVIWDAFSPAEKRIVTHRTPGVYCNAPADTIDYVRGYRCAAHPPRWSAEYARDCRRSHLPGSADAYRRTMIVLLGDSIVRRHTPTGHPRRPIAHGTRGGYRAHYRRGESMCEACRGAERRARGRYPMRYAMCGTRSAYQRHLRRGESCEECRSANTNRLREARHRRPPLPAGDPRHGTVNGYSNHRCRCPECVAINSQRLREWREARRAA